MVMPADTRPVVRFNDRDLRMEFGIYPNDRVAITLIDTSDPEFEERWCTATTNIPEIELADNEVVIKNYSENTGMLEALVAAGIVRDTGKRARGGHLVLPICELTVGEPG